MKLSATRLRFWCKLAEVQCIVQPSFPLFTGFSQVFSVFSCFFFWIVPSCNGWRLFNLRLETIACASLWVATAIKTICMCTMRTVRQLHHEHIKSQKSGQKISIIESRCTYFLVPLLVSMNIIFFRDKVGGGAGRSHYSTAEEICFILVYSKTWYWMPGAKQREVCKLTIPRDSYPSIIHNLSSKFSAAAVNLNIYMHLQNDALLKNERSWHVFKLQKN